MRMILAALMVVFIGACAAITTAQAADSTLRVLYAGKAGSERMADFKRFLSEHFGSVGTISLESFTPDAADAYDVVILDWVSIYPRDENGKVIQSNSMNMPRVPQVPAEYDRATLMIGSVAAMVGGQAEQQLKLDWL